VLVAVVVDVFVIPKLKVVSPPDGQFTKGVAVGLAIEALGLCLT
jgi:hypothetical protein